MTSPNELGRSGLMTGVGGYVLEELHPNLTGRQALLTWRAMKDNDALVGAILYAIDMLLRQVKWTVDQGDGKKADAVFLESCMDDMNMPWGDMISEVLTMIPFGFSVQEIVYKKRTGGQTDDTGLPTSKYTDGKIGWRKFAMRAQETLDHWQFDQEGGVLAFVQKPPPHYQDIVIPVQKLLLFRTSSYKNNPEGRSLLRSAYTSWFYKKRIQQIEGTGIERDLAGFPVFWMPSEYLLADASDEHKQLVQSFQQLGANIRRDKSEFLIMPLAYDSQGNKAFDFELTASAGTRAFDTGAIIQRYNSEIAMSVLADFILLGHENVGSFALSDDKTDLFAVSLGSVLDGIEDVFNRYAVPRLFELNGKPTADLPKIVHGDIETPDVGKLGAYLLALSQSGMTLFPDDDLDKYLREAGGLPEKSKKAQEAQDLAAQNAQTANDPTQTGAPYGGDPAAGQPGNGSAQGAPGAYNGAEDGVPAAPGDIPIQ